MGPWVWVRWGDRSVSKVISVQAQEPEFNPQNSGTGAKYGGVLAIPTLGRQRLADPWGQPP